MFKSICYAYFGNNNSVKYYYLYGKNTNINHKYNFLKNIQIQLIKKVLTPIPEERLTIIQFSIILKFILNYILHFCIYISCNW